MTKPRKELISILQKAHAGEAAAAFAYRGHWRSLRDPDQRDKIRKIEEEEWDHRARVRHWLEVLGSDTVPARERVFWVIGKLLGLLCFVSGWFFPMYFAGRLESRNTLEYREAANFAGMLGLGECEQDLLEMSDKEQEHEEYFRSVIAGHWLFRPARLVFRWG